MLAALQYGSAAIPHTECLGKRRNLNTSRTGETVSDRARPRRRPVSSNPVPLHHAGPRRAGGSGERQTERPTSDVNFHRRMPETPDEARYGAPAAGDSPSFARAAPNSAWKRSGTAGRLAVHHAWIARKCRRASGETSTRSTGYVPPSSTLLIKTIVTIEGVARSLNPDLNLVAAAVPIVLRAMSRKWFRWKFWRDLAMAGG